MVKASRKHKILRRIFLALVALVGISVLILSTVYIDISDRIPALLEEVRPNLYGDMNIKAASIKFLPRPTIRLTGFSLSNAEGPLVKSVLVKLRIKLIPLFSKKYRIDMLNFEGSDILFWRYADGTVNFSKIVKIKKLDIKVYAMSIRGGNLHVRDDLPGEGADFDFSSIDLDLKRTEGGLFKFGLTGKGNDGDEITITGESVEEAVKLAKADITTANNALAEDGRRPVETSTDTGRGQSTAIAGNVKAGGLDITLLAPYMKEKYPGLSFEGIIGLDGEYSIGSGFSYRGKVTHKNLKIPTPWLTSPEIISPSGSAVAEIISNERESRITLKDAMLTVMGVNLTGDFEYGGLREDPSIKLKLSAPPTGCEQVKALLPIKKMPKKITERIKAFKTTAGEIELKNLSISGPINELRKKGRLIRDRESFAMELEFTGVDFIYPGFDKKFTNISGTLEQGGSELRMEGFKGFYGTATIDGLSGEILNIGKNVSYDIMINSSFKAEDSLKELRKYVKALKSIEASGLIQASVEIKGKAGKGRSASGELTLNGNRIHHEFIPLHFSEATGKISFEPDKVSFKELTALHGTSTVTLAGDITFKGKRKTPELNLRTSGHITENSLIVLLRKKGVKAALPSFDGTAGFDILFKGVPGALEIDSSVNFKDTDFSFLNLIKKRRGYPVSYKSSILYKLDGLTINSMELLFGSSSFSASGSSSRDLLEYSIDIPKTSLRVADLDDILPLLVPDEKARGKLNLSIQLNKKRNEAGPRINGHLSIKDGTVKSVFLKNHLENVLLDARLEGKSGTVTLEKLVTGTTILNAKIDLLDIPAWKVNFKLSSPHANISDLIPEKRRRATTNSIKATGTGEILIKEGNIFGYPITDLKSSVNFNNDYLRLNKLSFTSNGSIVHGEVSYMRDPSDPLLYKSDLNLKNVDLNQLLSSLHLQDKENMTLTGTLDSRIKLSVKRGTDFTKGLNGDVEINIKEGKLWKFLVVSKIFSIVNIVSINALFEKGLPYDLISSTFKVKDGLFSTEDLFFESPSLRISAFGNVNAPKKTIDAKLGFHPFVTVDKIITKIPLAGWIIGGKNKSFLSMYYDIKGPLKDPDVYPVPVETIGKGIIGILQRTLVTPVKILTPHNKGDEETP